MRKHGRLNKCPCEVHSYDVTSAMDLVHIIVTLPVNYHGHIRPIPFEHKQISFAVQVAES